ncbi:hypothetical protein [Citreimonas sp.]
MTSKIIGAVTAAFAAVTASAAAAEWPEEPITFVVPYSPAAASTPMPAP